MDNPYQAQILDHYRNPRRRGTLEDADLSAELDNPVCGDVVRLDLQVDAGKVNEAYFSGRGCVISMAASSMLTEELVGTMPEQVEVMGLGDIHEMMGGIRLRLGHVKCALLALNAMKEGLEQAGAAASE